MQPRTWTRRATCQWNNRMLEIGSWRHRMSDEEVRISAGVRLGALLCQAHICVCGTKVDARGIHVLSCRKNAGRQIRHNSINDIVWRAMRRAGIPSIKEPLGLLRYDGKRPDGVTMIPWSRVDVWHGTSRFRTPSQPLTYLWLPSHHQQQQTEPQLTKRWNINYWTKHTLSHH